MATSKVQMVPAAEWATQAVTSIGLGIFIQRLVRHVAGGGALDEEALRTLGRAVAFEVKDAESLGLPIEQEAEAIGQGVEELQRVLDVTVARLRDGGVL